ncbi:hypothetical protein [Chryseobacterium nepalense]|nr:hypothetical protein [Chryseobacterium nepalense]
MNLKINFLNQSHEVVTLAQDASSVHNKYNSVKNKSEHDYKQR